MTVIRSGCAQMGLPNWVQEMVTGIIIVIAVALDRWRQRRKASAAA
jgi:ribose transport system permease protein